VMLEQDYLSLEKHSINTASTLATRNDMASVGADIVCEIVIPELTKEVNNGRNFSQLRQVYNSLILADWYKKKIKDSILEQVYAGRNKVAGVNINDPKETEKIYQRYLQAFKKGAYNYIKEEQDQITQQIVPRKYFSGGADFDAASLASAMSFRTDAALISQPEFGQAEVLGVDILPDQAMSSDAYKKVTVLRTGGTIEMLGKESRRNHNIVGDVAQELSGSIDSIEKVFENLPDSSNIGPKEWEAIIASVREAIANKKKLARQIGEGAGRSGGIVVTTGTDTVDEIAMILALEFSYHLDFPIVLTAAGIPMGEPGSDAADNFKLAVHAAQDEELPPGVYFAYRGNIHLGSRIKKFIATHPKDEHSKEKKDKGEDFESYGDVAAVWQDGKLRIKDWVYRLKDTQKPRYLRNKIPLSSGDVEHLFVNDSISLGVLRDAVKRLHEYKIMGHPAGLIIQGRIDNQDRREKEKWMALIQELINAKIPVFTGSSTMADKIWAGSGIMLLPPYLTFSKARTKLFWLLSKNVGFNDIKKEMKRDYAGEVTDLDGFPESHEYASVFAEDLVPGTEVIRAYPGMRAGIIKDAIKRLNQPNINNRRLVIYGFGDGNLPVGHENLESRISQWLNKDHPELYDKFLQHWKLNSKQSLLDRLNESLVDSIKELPDEELKKILIGYAEPLGMDVLMRMLKSNPEFLAHRLAKDALSDSNGILSALAQATDEGIDVLIRTHAYRSKSQTKLYELGNMLLAIGVHSEMSDGWHTPLQKNDFTEDFAMASDIETQIQKFLVGKEYLLGRPKAVIFDVHGTLLKETWKEEYANVYKFYKKCSQSEALAWVDENNKDLREKDFIKVFWATTHRYPVDLEDRIKEIRNAYHTDIMPLLKPGALKMIKALHERNIPIIITTSATYETIVRQLTARGFMPYLNPAYIFGGDNISKTLKEDHYTEENRGRFIANIANHLKGKYTILHFNDWSGGYDAVKEAGGINFGLPQGQGNEFSENEQLLKEAGADVILKNWEARNAIFETLCMNVPQKYSLLVTREEIVKPKDFAMTTKIEDFYQWVGMLRKSKVKVVEAIQKEIGEKYNLPQQTVGRILKKNGIKTTRVKELEKETKNVNKLKEWAKGFEHQTIKNSKRLIGIKFKVSLGSVDKVFKLYDIQTEEPKNIQKLRAVIKGGGKYQSQKQLASGHGVSIKIVRRVIKEEGVEPKKAGKEETENTKKLRKWAEGFKDQTVGITQKSKAEEYKLAVSIVNRIFQEYGIKVKKHVTEESENTKNFRKMIEGIKGKRIEVSQQELASKYNVWESTVSNILGEYGMRGTKVGPDGKVDLNKWGKLHRGQSIKQTFREVASMLGIQGAKLDKILARYDIKVKLETTNQVILREYETPPTENPDKEADLDNWGRNYKGQMMPQTFKETANILGIRGGKLNGILTKYNIKVKLETKNQAMLSSNNGQESRVQIVEDVNSLGGVEKVLDEIEGINVQVKAVYKYYNDPPTSSIRYPSLLRASLIANKPGLEYAFALDQNNKMIGYIFFEKRNNNEVYISYLAVLPNYIKQSVGIQLIRKAFEYASRSDLTLVELRTYPNTPAYSFYMNLPNRIPGVSLTSDEVVVGTNGGRLLTFSYNPDQAMRAKGGIDFTADKMPLQVQNTGEGIKFHMDPAQLAQLQNAPGFVPVIISVQPLLDLKAFLGIVNQS